MAAAAFDLQAHRGGRGLAPENTLAAFRQAVALGVTTLETDLAITQDDVVVISHEPRLNPDLVRGPDGQWLQGVGPTLHSLPLAALKRYDIGRLNPASAYGRQFPMQRPADGERFPTLAEVYAIAPAPMRLQHRDQDRPDAARQHGRSGHLRPPRGRAGEGQRAVDRTMIQSFDWRTLMKPARSRPRSPPPA